MDMADVKHLDKVGEDKMLPLLDRWCVCSLNEHCLSGRVYGHPRFDDGEIIHTSRVIWQTATQLQTRNTLYRLGCEGNPYA